ncbi:MAG: carboxymuconolactone decarboxylase family protein [Bryobacteraceae bacterium]
MNRKTKALLAAAWMCTVSVAAAQDRFPPISEDKMTPAQKKVSDAVKAGPRGALNGPFIPLLRSPELDNRVQAVGEYLRYGSAIGRRLTEFTILITARHWTQNYEWATHYTIALKEGVKKDVADAIGDGRRPVGMTEEEEIVYEFCTELQENKSVTDATFARAQKKFGDQGVIDMTGLVGYYTLLATILNVARTPTDVPNPPLLKPFPK